MSNPNFLATSEVAKIFGGVDHKTIHSWEEQGKLEPSARTPGKHRFYRVSNVVDVAKALGWPVSAELEARAEKARAEAAAA